LERALDRRSAQWVGRRSFTLYLIHVPILLCIDLALGGNASTAVLMVVTLPTVLLATAAFHLAIERPSHRLANATGRWATRLTFGIEPAAARVESAGRKGK
jgi:peptidoglycan/LPS O-acetylase OafA/YrhL